jgi:transposase
MLDQSTRAAILQLQQRGHSIRGIARAMKLSRNAVREVLRSATEVVPHLVRPEKAAPYREQILELYARCKGNLVRVHEELLAEGAQVSYSALTAFCRRQGIGQPPKVPIGEFHFPPGREMQTDTSPHRVEIDNQLRPAQTSALVLCYSRLLFFQLFSNFTRFECKLFLDEASQYDEGVCEVCLTDNTHVVVLHGTGRNMVPAPEMAAFAERYGFRFQAHEIGDANRSAYVERSFWFIEKNFLAGRSFADWDDANRQAREWCDRVNAQYRRKLKASPRELWATERAYLKPRPAWVPPIYRLHQRLVDMAGYVSVNSNRYSVPEEFLGMQVEVRETKDTMEIYRGPRRIASHGRVLEATGRKYSLPEHHRPRGQGHKPKPSEPAPEETRLRQEVPEMVPYVEALKKHYPGRATQPLRRLLRLIEDYPRVPLLEAIASALQYGLFDLERVESLILSKLSCEYFRIEP